MATGDILSAVVRADGWSMDVTIEGFTTGATYDFGSLDDTPATVTAPMFSVAVVSEGYSAAGVLGTIARTVYGTHVVRKPYPDQASKDETVSGSDLVVRVALSESIYNDDKNGGAGTSGTNPAVTISAGWATNTGGAAQTSAAATALACTNNSTLDYPKCIAQWAWGHTPAWKRVAAAFDMGTIAYHGHGIACVALSATEGVNVVSGIATAPTAHQMSASQLYYESYDLNVPLTSMTQGNDITLKFVAYPLVGDADSIIDTSATTGSTYQVAGHAQITCTCDKTGALIDYAVVSTAGNDTTGAKSTTLATAEASPYLTIGKALASGASVIYCRTGTYDILGSTPSSVAAKNYAVEISPYPAESVTINRSGTWKATRAKIAFYSGFTVTGDSWLDGEAGAARKLFLSNCSFSGTLNNKTSGLGYRYEGCWFNNCSWSSEDTFAAAAVSIAYVMVGCLHSAGAVVYATPSVVATKITGGGTDRTQVREKNTSTAPITENCIYANNSLMAAATSTVGVMRAGDGFAINGTAIVGNVIEAKSGTQYVAWIGADSATLDINNLLLCHNTIAGQRINFCYNDSGGAENVRTNVFFRNNALNGFAIKSDTFVTQNAARVGNWAQMNGVNLSDNRYTYQASLSSFVCDYAGINVKYEDTGAAVANEMGFTDDNSTYGDGTGNGDYMPTEASVLYDHALRQAYQSYDLYGVAL